MARRLGGRIQAVSPFLEFARLSHQALALSERHARFASQLLQSPFERIEVRSHAEGYASHMPRVELTPVTR